MHRIAARYFLAIAMLMPILGCGNNARLEQAEKQQRDAEARAQAALKKAEDARLAAEKALADKDAAEKKATEDRAAADRARADKDAAEKLAAEEKERARKAQEEKVRIERTQQANAKSTAPNPRSTPVTTRKIPGYVTAYDIMTPEDEFYFHHLDNMCPGGDLAQWPLVKALVGLGQNLVDANLLANLANETVHISDQPRAAPIIKMVNECAEILQVKAPPVHIDGSPEPNAYVAGLREPHVLVFTSGLLELYDESPEELRFIIGHELGHIKAKHLKTHFLGSTLVGALVGDRSKNATFKADFIAAMSIGTLLHWYRESEYSADRAGLICVGGDIKVAKQALLRLIHQTKPSNKLFDPSHPDFDAQLVLKNQLRLRDEPFVKVISYLRQWRQTHPFIPERCAALGMWSLSAEYQTIVERPKSAPTERSIVITSIEVKNVPKVDTYVPFVDSGAADPFVKLTHAGSTAQTSHGVDLVDAVWSEPNIKLAYSDGAGLILELFDYNAALSNTFIGSCLLPIPSTGKSGTIKADVRLDVLTSSTIVDRPTVTVQYRIEPKQ